MTRSSETLTAQPGLHPPLIADVRPPAHPLARFCDRFLVFLFVAALAIPFIGTWLHWDPIGPLSENRALAAWPKTPDTFREATRWPDRFLSYFSDHFGFRNTLLHNADALLFHIAGPANGASAVVGKDGWFFLHALEEDRSFAVENGFLPFTEAELDQWQMLFERRQKYLAARHIAFIVVIPPDKQSIYPEFFPTPIKTPTRLDQLIDRLKKTASPVTLLDLRPSLLAAKARGGGVEIYRRSDTHWNGIGAYIGYCDIINAVARALPGRAIVPQPVTNFYIRQTDSKGGDIVALLDLDEEIPERRLEMLPLHPLPFTFFPKPPEVHISDIPDPSLPRLLMYRDSFATAIFPMIVPHFSHCYWIWEDRLSASLIDQQKPDVIIDEFVERKLYGSVPIDPPAIRDTPGSHEQNP